MHRRCIDAKALKVWCTATVVMEKASGEGRGETAVAAYDWVQKPCACEVARHGVQGHWAMGQHGARRARMGSAYGAHSHVAR